MDKHLSKDELIKHLRRGKTAYCDVYGRTWLVERRDRMLIVRTSTPPFIIVPLDSYPSIATTFLLEMSDKWRDHE